MSAPNSARLLGRGWLLVVVAALWLFGSTGSAVAQQKSQQAAAQGIAPGATVDDTSDGLRMDRRIEAVTATGYQTAIVAGLAGGVVLAGMAVGTHAAVLAGTAVLVGYVFLPWE